MLDKSDKQFLHDSIETTVAQLSGAMIKALENVATKEDLTEVKEEVRDLKGGVSELKTEIKYLRNDVNDLKADSPTAGEFRNHEVRIRKLETFHASA